MSLHCNEFDSMKSIHKASLQPSGKCFDVLPEQSILESGLGSGLALPFGCANGSCGDCKAIVRNGSVKKIKQHDYALTDVEKLNGYCLMCSYTPSTDIELEVMEASSVHDIAEQELSAKPCRIEHSQGIGIITFKFVRGKALRFLPGQSATLLLPTKEKVTLPIASCPCNANIVEFHLVQDSPHPSADNARALMGLATTRARLTITGPSGEFTLSTATKKQKLFIARGGDFAQLQGMLELVLSNDNETQCALVWYATEHTGQYKANLCRAWHDAFDEFSYIPAKSSEPLGVVLPQSLKENLKHFEIYLGSSDGPIVDTLMQLGVEPEAIFAP